jgi:Raf kinase inhibitor-like YbhB/YbcL family protein
MGPNPLLVLLALSASPGGATMAMTLSSPAFAPGAEIPSTHTCEGADTPPVLAWSGAPAGTRSFALIVDDPDAPDPQAPKMTWVHWVVFGIPASATGLSAGNALGKVGKNDWGKAAWGGPCPPIGRHRYFFKLYALDVALDGLATANKPALEAAMKGHIMGQAELVGTYQKKR